MATLPILNAHRMGEIISLGKVHAKGFLIKCCIIGSS